MALRWLPITIHVTQAISCQLHDSQSPAGYEGVTTAAALDMQSGVALDPMAEFLALGTHPNQGDTPAVGVIGLTLSVEQAGGKASYAPRCTDTDVVGMACERITGEAAVNALFS